MRTLLRGVALGLLLGVGAVGVQANEASLPRLYVIGDSISMQYGPYLEQNLAGTMHYARKTGEEEAALDQPAPHNGNGGDSARVLAFLQAKAAAGGIDADVLLLNCGLHDIKTDPDTGSKQVPLAAYRDNLEAIVALVARLDLELIWVRTTPCDERVHNKPGKSFFRFAADAVAYNDAADAIMAAKGVPSIDLHGFTSRLGDDLYKDHVHFPPAICEKQAAYIAGYLAHWRQSGQTPE